MSLATLSAGRFLVARNALRDNHFFKSVIFLCDHNADGSFGLIVNRPLNLKVSDVTNHGNQNLDAYHDQPVYQGGPVQSDCLFCLHAKADDDLGAVTVQVVDPLTWQGPDQNPDLRFYLGYSGWGKGQLEGELAAGAWDICPAQWKAIFRGDPDRLWNMAKAKSQMGEGPFTDPRFN